LEKVDGSGVFRGFPAQPAVTLPWLASDGSTA
jgi:hypothetical protein